MRFVLLFIALVSFLTQAQFDSTYSCADLDTLETWQGVKYCMIKSNPDGKLPKKGDKIYVKYKGYFENGVVFDSTNDNPFSFRLKKMQVISGWDIVFERIKAGEKIRVMIPWKYAYGKYGKPPTIPRKANLIFDIEVVGIVEN